MTDAEIFYRNVVRECEKQGRTLGSVERGIGISQGILAYYKYKGSDIRIGKVKEFAKELGVSPLKLMEGMLD